MNSGIATIPSLPPFLMTEVFEAERAPARPSSVPPPIPRDALSSRRLREAVYRNNELLFEEELGFSSNAEELPAVTESRTGAERAGEVLLNHVIPAGLSYAAVIGVVGFLWFQFALFGGSAVSSALSFPGVQPGIAATSPAPALFTEKGSGR